MQAVPDPSGELGRGPDVSPVWNPKTGAQIAFVSGRSGLPQIYIMDADGTNLQRMTDQGYAVSPSWSPNGQFLAFAWRRNYGPGAPGGWEHLRDGRRHKQFIQLTHDAGNNDFPNVVAGWPPHRIPAWRQWSRTDMDHASRRQQGPTPYPTRGQIRSLRGGLSNIRPALSGFRVFTKSLGTSKQVFTPLWRLV